MSSFEELCQKLENLDNESFTKTFNALSADVLNSLLAITDHAGQQDVAIKSSFSGTSSRKSLASATVHISAPMDTSVTALFISSI